LLKKKKRRKPNRRDAEKSERNAEQTSSWRIFTALAGPRFSLRISAALRLRVFFSSLLVNSGPV
jgi:hypothetical protein